MRFRSLPIATSCAMMYDHPFISQNQHPLLGENVRFFRRFAGILAKKRENVWQSKIPACIFPRFRVQYKRRKNQQYAKILMEYIYENDIEMYTMLMGLNKMKGFVHQRVEEFLTEMFKLEDLYTNEHKTENMPFPKYLSLCYQASSYAREKAMPILLQIPSSIAGI